MYRVLTGFLLIFICLSESSGQGVQSLPLLKNGRLTASESLMHHRINHSSWQACRYGDQYYFVLQLNQTADEGQKAVLARRGIRIEHYLSRNFYLASCKSGSDLTNPELAGIENMYSLPGRLKDRCPSLKRCRFSKKAAELPRGFLFSRKPEPDQPDTARPGGSDCGYEN